MTEPVRARYASAAQRLADLPLEDASLGCGNPVAVADLRPGDTVLDLGSGAGLDVLTSARRVGPTGHAIGLDMTEDMLTLARRHAAEQQVTNAESLPVTMSRACSPRSPACCGQAADSGSATSWPTSASPTPNAPPGRTASSTCPAR